MHRRLQVDDLIGEYRVTGFLGEGGMGVVYSGVHQKLGRPAAIKILGMTERDESFKARFFNEARLQASLHHPNIATLYDFRDEGDELVIFMELVDGECLGDLISRRAFTIDETLGVFSSICDAISFVHRNGVIHRDIKAENAKLTSSGAVKLLDFGIAKDSASNGLTQAGGIIGTPNYLSPEQFEGSPASVQTDIWALGILLYQMLTGELPFEGNTLGGLVSKITRAEFQPPDKLNPAVPRDISAIVTRCLKRNPADRYTTVDDLNAAVHKARRSRAGSPARESLPRTSISVGDRMADTETPEFHTTPRPAARVAGVSGLLIGIGVAAILLVTLSVGAGYLLLSGPSSSPAGIASAKPVSSDSSKGTKIRVDVDEGTAQVVRNGVGLGKTPLDIDASLGEKISLTLRRDGYEDKDVAIEVTNSKKVFTFALKKK